jgi:hypothetical protein
MGNDGSTFGVWSGWNDLNLSYSFSSNTWYHLAVSVDETGNCVIYVDGAQLGVGTLAVPLATVSNGSAVRIGQSTHQDPTPQFVGLVEGKIDELGVWNRVLTACEIEALYTNFNYTVTQTSNTLTVAESGINYQWLQCGGGSFTEISGANGQSFDPTATGSYAVVLDDGGCVDTSACFNFGFADVYEDNVSGLKIYPTPASENVFVESPTAVYASLYNQLGELIFTFETNGFINLSELESGIYFVRTEDGVTQKFAKK